MKVTNVVLARSGSVGSSHIAWWLAQHFQSFHRNTYCVDASLYPTFAFYSGLQVDYIELADPNKRYDRFNLRAFDPWVTRLLSHDGPCVMDVGSWSFFPFFQYMNEADVFSLLKKIGHRVIIHVPLVGDGRENATVSCLKLILEQTEADIVVWENEFFGAVDVGAKLYSDPSLSVEIASRLLGCVKIMRHNASTFGRDIQDVMMADLTIEEALSRPEFGVMPKRRLSILRQRMFEQLQAIPALSTPKSLIANISHSDPLAATHRFSFVQSKTR